MNQALSRATPQMAGACIGHSAVGLAAKLLYSGSYQDAVDTEQANSWIDGVQFTNNSYAVGDGMNTLSSQQVVDQIAATLAERRQQARSRRGAYLALAQAILSDGSG